jgi:hypothetical protein
MTADAAARDVLADRISEIEEAYEFMLSHAAQGHQRGTEGDLIRNYLERADARRHRRGRHRSGRRHRG